MNTSHLAALMLENFKTIGICFSHNGKQYTYKVPKTTEIALEDKVMVYANGEFQVVTVTRVDEIPLLDTNAPYPFKFIVQKVDTEQYEKLSALDAKVERLLVETEKRKKQQEVMQLFKDTLSVPALETLQAEFKELGIEVKL